MEADVALSQAYSQAFISTTAIVKLGLTATCESTNTVYKKKVEQALHGNVRQSKENTVQGIITDEVNKGQLLEIVCPVVYRYTTEMAIDDGVITPYQTFIVEHEFDNVKKLHKAWKKNRFLQTELQTYTTWDTARKNFMTPAFIKKNAGLNMAKFLWTLPSKVPVAKALLKQLTGNTIVFGLTLDYVEQITLNVVRSGKDADGKKYPDYVTLFNNGEVKEIGTVKKLERGITLNNLHNVIIVGWYSTASSFLQRLGRALRLSEGKTIANIYIFVTKGSFEENRWFDTINKLKDSEGEITEEINLNIVGVISSKTIVNNGKSDIT